MESWVCTPRLTSGGPCTEKWHCLSSPCSQGPGHCVVDSLSRLCGIGRCEAVCALSAVFLPAAYCGVAICFAIAISGYQSQIAMLAQGCAKLAEKQGGRQAVL